MSYALSSITIWQLYADKNSNESYFALGLLKVTESVYICMDVWYDNLEHAQVCLLLYLLSRSVSAGLIKQTLEIVEASSSSGRLC